MVNRVKLITVNLLKSMNNFFSMTPSFGKQLGMQEWGVGKLEQRNVLKEDGKV